jgi:hypothetical protein
MSSPTLSTLTREEIEARCAHLEDVARRAVRISDELMEHLKEARAENTAMAAVLQQQVIEHTELRRQLHEAAPLAVTAALADAGGWQMHPTVEEAKAHGAAHPYDPPGVERDEGGDPDDGANGLWAVKDRGGVTLVEIGAFKGQLSVWPVGALGFYCENPMLDLEVHEPDLQFLRLTSAGRPAR